MDPNESITSVSIHNAFKKRSSLLKKIKKYKVVYLLLLPTVISCFIFNYIPMSGVLMAFKQYRVGQGFAAIFTSPNVGFMHFKRLFTSYYFYTIMRNTLLISFYKIIFVFPAPIIFALLLNELSSRKFKRIVQTVTYLPNFLSTVVVSGLVIAFLSPTYGLLNSVIHSLGYDPIFFLGDARYFRSIIVIIDAWKSTGWSAIIYLAAITSIDQEIYEAARIDGASKFKQIWHITLPELSNLIILLFILRIGDILNAGFDMIFLLYSPPVYSVGDIIDTYVYREGLVNSSFSFSTAVNLFKSVAGFILIVVTNKIANKFGKQGIW